MSVGEPTFYCIDMKTFYASVECAERGLNPFETDLVVADVTRGKNALCLAITPKMKARGIHNRCRLSDIPGNVHYEIAPPRMKLYVDYAAEIYGLYLNYFAPADIHVYSIDEAFIDATKYLKTYRSQPVDLAKLMMNEIADRLHIPSTAGVGTNLYLAKIALDITAKHAKDHIGFLNETLYKEQLWDHQPITDFWQISSGTSKRLASRGIYTMRGIAQTPEDLLYGLFGINAELLIDHANGRESCTMNDIKSYRTKSSSVSFSQILPRDYTFDEARIVMTEMVINGARELLKRRVITRKVWVGISYSRDILPSDDGACRLLRATALVSELKPAALTAFDAAARRDIPIRRLAITFLDVCDEECEGYDLFSDLAAIEKERTAEHTMLDITERFGKNALLRGVNLKSGATQRERNEMIGGHRAGYDDPYTESKTVSAI